MMGSMSFASGGARTLANMLAPGNAKLLRQERTPAPCTQAPCSLTRASHALQPTCTLEHQTPLTVLSAAQLGTASAAWHCQHASSMMVPAQGPA